MTEPKQADQARAAVRTAALGLLARREHSKLELEQKLNRRGFSTVLIDSELEKLTEQELLSEQRFAEQFTASRIRKNQGPMKILAELGRRGIDRHTANRVLGDATADWPAMAAQVICGMGLDLDAEKREVQQTIYRRLHNRGYRHDHIKQALRLL